MFYKYKYKFNIYVIKAAGEIFCFTQNVCIFAANALFLIKYKLKVFWFFSAERTGVTDTALTLITSVSIWFSKFSSLQIALIAPQHSYISDFLGTGRKCMYL